MRQTVTMNAEGTRGFTLIEMVVAVALFSVVMLVSVGTLLSLVAANRKARALESVMNNLNITIDGVARSIRQGSEYSCGAGGDCQSGSDTFEFIPFHRQNDPIQHWIYWRETDAAGHGHICISKSGTKISPCDSWLTAPEVSIDSLQFYVVGTEPLSLHNTNTVQPKAVIVINGTANPDDPRTRSSFQIEATAVQRQLDL